MVDPKRWAIIDKDNKVVNVVIWDGPSTEWVPPRGHIVAQCAFEVGIGYGYNPEKNVFVAPVVED